MLNKQQRRIAHLPCDLYKAYDHAGHLLYVGISANVFNRLKEHKYYARWYPQAVRLEVAQYADRGAARFEEARCIREDGPVYNVTKERAWGAVGSDEILEQFTMYQDRQGWYIL